jgi:GPH family glycoside/pentoside/hexuronide:cation symporter
MFYSLISLMQKIASSIAIPLILVLLDATGYAPNAAQQAPSALQGIRLVVGPIPAVLLWAGILFAWLYPLSRAEYSHIVAGLEKRRVEAKAELPESV